jgi:hypothetical protein
MAERLKIVISIERLALGVMAILILNFATVIGLVSVLFAGVGIYISLNPSSTSSALSGFVVIGSIAFLSAFGAAAIALWAAKIFLSAQKKAIIIFSVLLFGWYLVSGLALKHPDYVAISISVVALGIIFVRRKHLQDDG